jgi:hypothetical protein
MTTKSPRKSIYSVHPSLAMVEASMRNLLERTGKSAADWAAIVERDGPPGEKERREWLKAAHGFTHELRVVDRRALAGQGARAPRR